MCRLIAVMTIMLMISPAFASGSMELGVPSYGGTGCPAGSATVALTPDKKSVIMLFDDYFAYAGANGKRLDRKACGLAVPLHVPQGYSVSILRTDFFGFSSIPFGGSGELKSEYFFAGETGQKFVKEFTPGTSEPYHVSDTIAMESKVWSPCGKDVVLRNNTSIIVKTNREYKTAYATLDAMSARQGVLFSVAMKQCGSTVVVDDGDDDDTISDDDDDDDSLGCNQKQLDICLQYGGGNACYPKWCS